MEWNIEINLLDGLESLSSQVGWSEESGTTKKASTDEVKQLSTSSSLWDIKNVDMLLGKPDIGNRHNLCDNSTMNLQSMPNIFVSVIFLVTPFGVGFTCIQEKFFLLSIHPMKYPSYFIDHSMSNLIYILAYFISMHFIDSFS